MLNRMVSHRRKSTVLSFVHDLLKARQFSLFIPAVGRSARSRSLLFGGERTDGTLGESHFCSPAPGSETSFLTLTEMDAGVIRQRWFDDPLLKRKT